MKSGPKENVTVVPAESIWPVAEVEQRYAGREPQSPLTTAAHVVWVAQAVSSVPDGSWIGAVEVSLSCAVAPSAAAARTAATALGPVGSVLTASWFPGDGASGGAGSGAP